MGDLTERLRRGAKMPVPPVMWLSEAADEINRLEAALDAEKDQRNHCMTLLRDKDKAMGVLFDRMRAAGVDFSDLIP